MVRSGEIEQHRRDEFREKGFVVVRGFFDADELAALRRLLLQRFDVLRRADQRKLKRYTREDNAWLSDELIRRVLLSEKVGFTAAGLLGCNAVRLYHTASLFKEPGDGEVPWHQDQFVSPIDSPAVGCWLALTDVRREMGSVVFAQGSHKLGLLPEFESAERAEEMLVASGCSIRAPELNAGDAIFHSSMGWHMSSANSTSLVREAVGMFFFPDGARVLPSLTARQRTEWRLFFPGTLPGEFASSVLNPLVYEAGDS